MSLDVDLYRKRWTSYDEGKTLTEDLENLYSANVTHNLGNMADAAGIYEALWRPHRLIDGYNIPEDDHEAEWKFEDSVTILAEDIIEKLETGLKDLKKRPKFFQKFDSSNGWGTYERFVPFVENYLNACKEFPKAIVKTDR